MFGYLSIFLAAPLLLLGPLAQAQQQGSYNGLAVTPAMGWVSKSCQLQ